MNRLTGVLTTGVMLLPLVAVSVLLVVGLGPTAALLPGVVLVFMAAFYVYWRRLRRRIDADPGLADRLQRRDQENLTNVGKAMALIFPITSAIGALCWALSKLAHWASGSDYEKVAASDPCLTPGHVPTSSSPCGSRDI